MLDADKKKDCWRDPLPLVAKTARKLVSKLAILFHSLANDVRIIAENAGLEWKWRQDNGIVVNEGTWVGHCDMVSGTILPLWG